MATYRISVPDQEDIEVTADSMKIKNDNGGFSFVELSSSNNHNPVGVAFLTPGLVVVREES